MVGVACVCVCVCVDLESKPLEEGREPAEHGECRVLLLSAAKCIARPQQDLKEAVQLFTPEAMPLHARVMALGLSCQRKDEFGFCGHISTRKGNRRTEATPVHEIQLS